MLLMLLILCHRLYWLFQTRLGMQFLLLMLLTPCHCLTILIQLDPFVTARCMAVHRCCVFCRLDATYEQEVTDGISDAVYCRVLQRTLMQRLMRPSNDGRMLYRNVLWLWVHEM